jgi:cell division protein FtsQ
MDMRRKGKYILSPFQYILHFSKFAILGLLVAAVIFIANRIHLSRAFPINMVRIYGIRHIDKQEMKNLLLPFLAKGFFGVQVGLIKDKLTQISWVSHIFVRRTWPNQLDIIIIEKNAVAKWNNQDLLSQTGELFTPDISTYPVHLPEFVGPIGKQVVMLQYFNDINRLLQSLRVKITYLELTPYLTWKLILDNGMMIHMGHKDILTRLSHFVKVYPQIIGIYANNVDYIDLRYPNGLAVKWKSYAHLPHPFLMRKNTYGETAQ